MNCDEAHIEKPLGKERLSLAEYYPSNQTKGRSGSVNRLPLSPALEATASLDNLFEAVRLRSKGVAWKDSVLGFRANIIPNIVKLRKELLEGSYKILPYLWFLIYEPKRREIEATAFRDGVVQKSLCKNYLYNEITRHFIYDNAANQVGKGTDFARKRLKCQLHRFERKHGLEGWVVQFDIHNFLWKFVSQVSKAVGRPERPRPIRSSLLLHGY